MAERPGAASGLPFRRRPEGPGDTRPPALFLEPQPYRRRRLIDAVRALPLFATLLMLGLPLLLSRGLEGTTGALLIYLFLVWLGVIALAAILSRLLSLLAHASGPSDMER